MAAALGTMNVFRLQKWAIPSTIGPGTLHLWRGGHSLISLYSSTRLEFGVHIRSPKAPGRRQARAPCSPGWGTPWKFPHGLWILQKPKACMCHWEGAWGSPLSPLLSTPSASPTLTHTSLCLLSHPQGSWVHTTPTGSPGTHSPRAPACLNPPHPTPCRPCQWISSFSLPQWVGQERGRGSWKLTVPKPPGLSDAHLPGEVHQRLGRQAHSTAKPVEPASSLWPSLPPPHTGLGRS